MARKTKNGLDNDLYNKSLNPILQDVVDSAILFKNYGEVAKNFSNAVTITGDVTLDATHFAHPVVVTADAVLTLPATALGQHLNIVCGADGVKVTVSPDADDKFIFDVAGAAGTDDTDIILESATSKSGDYVKLQADGTNGWNILELGGTWVDE